MVFLFAAWFRQMEQTLRRRQNHNRWDTGAAEWLLNSISFPSTVLAENRKGRRWLHVVRRLLRRCIHLGGMYQRGSGRIRRRHISGECWLEPRVRYRFKARSELDQRWLAESGSDETDAHRHAQYVCRRHINDRISWSPGQPRAGEDEVIGEDQIGGPAGAVGRSDDSI